MTQAIQPIPIPTIECRVCGESRRNDGLTCPHCNSYQNPEIGRPLSTDSWANLQWQERKNLEQDIIARRRRKSVQ